MSKINFAISDWKGGQYHILVNDFDLSNPVTVCGAHLSPKKWVAITTGLKKRHRMCLNCKNKIIRPKSL